MTNEPSLKQIEMGQRIAARRDDLRLIQRDLAKMIGVTRPAITQYESGKNTPRFALLPKLAAALKTTPEWLIFGTGPNEEPATEGEFDPDVDPVNLVKPTSDHLPLYAGDVRDGMIEIGNVEYASIGRYDAALSAGPGSLLEPVLEPLGYHLIEGEWLRRVTSAAPRNLAVCRVDGDSMVPTFQDDDWVLLDLTQRRLSRQGIYAFRVFEDVWVKRLTLNLKDQMIQVISDNQLYPLQELNEDQIEIIGRVLFLVARKI